MLQARKEKVSAEAEGIFEAVKLEYRPHLTFCKWSQEKISSFQVLFPSKFSFQFSFFCSRPIGNICLQSFCRCVCRQQNVSSDKASSFLSLGEEAPGRQCHTFSSSLP